jgi:hypothetical protein
MDLREHTARLIAQMRFIAVTGALVVGLACCGRDEKLSQAVADANVDGPPDALPTAFCEGLEPTRIARGFLVGADADRVFIRDTSLYVWPKAGGQLELFPRQDIGRIAGPLYGHARPLTVSGSTYYWLVEDRDVLVTDRDGVTLASVTIPGTGKVELATAPNDAVYARMSCLAYAPSCTDGVDRILLLSPGANAPTEIVASTRPILAMASDGDTLIWLERFPNYSTTIQTWTAAGGQQTLVATAPAADDNSQVLAVRTALDARDLFYGISEGVTRYALDTGELLETYQRPYPPVHHLRISGAALYWTRPITPVTGPFCTTLNGLERRTFDGSIQTIDESAFDAPFSVDDLRVYYESGQPRCCWSSGFVTCPTATHEVWCAKP